MDTINPAEFDTRIVIEAATIVKDGMGDSSKTWNVIGKAWAKWQWSNSSENVDMNQVVTDQAATVTIRYRSDITNACRLLMDGQYYYVTAVTPGHRQGPVEMTVSKRDNG
jgi:SPP1 family predicted phage head-tail adaptor